MAKEAKAAVAVGSELTDSFKQSLQEIILETTGQTVSKQKAWDLFKGVINGTVKFVLGLKDNRLPLSGVGIFTILRSSPRRSKVGVFKYVPRFRFSPSSRIDAFLEDNMDCFEKGKTREDIVPDGKGSNLPPRKATTASAPKVAPKVAPKAAPKAVPEESTAVPEVEDDFDFDE